MLDSEATVASFDPAFTPPTGDGRIGLAFLCDSPAEVDAAHARLTGAGYRSHLDPFDAFWGQRYATVLDPDGIGVDLFAPLSWWDGVRPVSARTSRARCCWST